MPLSKSDKTQGHGISAEGGATTGQKFPPEAYAYDSDITDHVIKRVQSEAEKILCNDEWVVVDGVDKR
jgi:hypothetical protein